MAAVQNPDLPPVNAYLFDIDKQKRKIRLFSAPLAHEWGQGCPCRCGNCPGLDLHFWRKICKNCKCRPEIHEVPVEEDPGKLRIGRLFDGPVKTRLEQLLISNSNAGAEATTKPATTGERSGHLPMETHSEGEEKFEWTPPNISKQMVNSYMAALPEEARPIANSIGALKRKELIERQLPLYDHDEAKCHELTVAERRMMTKYVEDFKQSAIGVGFVHDPIQLNQMLTEAEKMDTVELQSQSESDKQQTTAVAVDQQKDISSVMSPPLSSKWKCRRCEQPMQSGDLAVFAERAGTDVLWHPACFCCNVCNELLADLIYFYKKEDGHIYCGRHFGDSCFPRCSGCDELIFANEYTQAEEKAWHIKHFCCFNCDTPLGGGRYMFKQNRTFCLNCYAQLFARTCQACGKKIEADVQRISQGELHWHATTDCFYCQFCKKSLLGNRFLLKQDKVFCTKECKINFFTPPLTCNFCHKDILATEERLEDGGHCWHATADCFKCVQCAKGLIGQEHLLSKSGLFCEPECLLTYKETHKTVENGGLLDHSQQRDTGLMKQTDL